MPSEHAVLSPSAAERWIACPASIRMAEKVPPAEESVYAAEGTAAHSLAEIEASYAFGLSDEVDYERARARWVRANVDLYDIEEMADHADSYVALLRERLDLYPNSQLFLEQRLPTGVPNCWGTSDAVIVSPAHVEVVDLKYGMGIAVDAEGNPQLRLYALGALDNIADLLGEVQLVRYTVFQPRLSHVTSETLTPEELRRWRDEVVLPKAEEALSDDASFGPSDEACRWCPASGRCRAQLEAVFATDFDEDTETLDGDDLAEALGRVPLIKTWLGALEVTALDRVYSRGESIPGYKVVRSGGRRVVTDPEGAMRELEEFGYTRDQIGQYKINGVGALEKLVGKAHFDDVLGAYVTKTEGNPALVPEGDKRPSINPNAEAAKEFTEGTEEA